MLTFERMILLPVAIGFIGVTSALRISNGIAPTALVLVSVISCLYLIPTILIMADEYKYPKKRRK